MAHCETMSELEMSPEQMRQFGYLVVDRMVDLLEQLDRGPVFTPASAEEMVERIPTSPPVGPTDFKALLSVIEHHVAPAAARWGHPRTFAYIPGRGTWPGALADFMTSALNIDASSWRESPAPIHLELVVIDWFRSWLGLPATAGGLLVGGGSAANLTALAVARQSRIGTGDPDARIYCTSEAHSSVARAARVLGFAPEAVSQVDLLDGVMSVGSLQAAIAADRSAGRHPIAVVATAGATSTGAVDPLAAIADIARREGLWLHVDGAYGGFATLTERGRSLLAGIELADSVTLDPHKWLYQPVEVGALLVRDPSLLEGTFSMRPPYLQDTTDRAGETNMVDRGLQQTRSVRALKVWLSLMTFGVEAFAGAIDHSMDLAAHVERRVTESVHLELMSRAQLSIVCFRRRARDEKSAEELNRRLTEELLTSGVGFLSSTRVDGRYTLRMCVLNHTTSLADVDAVIDWLEQA
jgi:aromatic-L-amino-acid/L-tryptophan decarboxylase